MFARLSNPNDNARHSRQHRENENRRFGNVGLSEPRSVRTAAGGLAETGSPLRARKGRGCIPEIVGRCGWWKGYDPRGNQAHVPHQKSRMAIIVNVPVTLRPPSQSAL